VLKERLPWWVKMIAKAFLARLPLSGVLKQKLDIFRHGQMDDPAYAARIFAHHLARFQKPLTPWTCLELGPGDSLFTALLAKAAGAEKIWLVDAGDFAATSVDSFKTLARQLTAEGKPVPDLSACQTRAEVLAACNAVYLTNGLAGLKTIPEATVDFIFSNAVLEHVRKADMPETLAELARIMKPSGLQSHTVDLRDHLQNGLNNLRFSEQGCGKAGCSPIPVSIPTASAFPAFLTCSIAPVFMLPNWPAPVGMICPPRAMYCTPPFRPCAPMI
jgi:SAM-dependent methyltransferase